MAISFHIESLEQQGYAIREYPIEVLVDKYLVNEDTNENEIFIPDYQRDFIWSVKQQSRFIESVMIGLPIPYPCCSKLSI
jgi:uncharacterized protein with ParB-like and HNH nuclease domain